MPSRTATITRYKRPHNETQMVKELKYKGKVKYTNTWTPVCYRRRLDFALMLIICSL